MNASEPGGGFREDGPDTGGSWVEGVDGFAEGERLRLAVESRRRDRWRRARVADSVTVASTLRAAIGSQVTVHLVTGAQLHGQVLEVGADVLGLGGAGGLGDAAAAGGARVRWVAIAAIEAVGITGAPAHDAHGVDRTLAEVLEDLRGGDPVVVHLTGGGTLSGEVVGNGDAVTLRDAGTGDRVVIERSAIVVVVV